MKKNNQEFKISENENIETLFKVEPPLTEIDKPFFGYMGVVLRDKIKDKIQCHLCGEWTAFMGSHVKKHKIKLVDYRKKFGLPLSFPLCSVGWSKRMSESHSSQAIADHMRDIAKISLKKANKATHSKKGKNNWMYGFKNPARENMFGCCPEQLKKRYEIVADLAGRNPSYKDMSIHDKGLWSAVCRRYGSMNKFRKLNGYDVNKHRKAVEPIRVLSKIIEYFEKHKRVPTSEYFRTGEVTLTAVYNHFGSLKRAVSCAGIEEGTS